MTLRLKTFLPLGILSALFFSFLYGYWFPTSLRALEEQEVSATQRHVDSLAQALVPLLLAHDLATIYENLDALRAQNQDWTSIRLVDADGRTTYPLQDGPVIAMGGSLHLVERSIHFLERNLGRLVVIVDTAPRMAAATARQKQLVVALLAVFCGYLASVWVIVDRVVTRPVGILARAAQRLAKADFDAPLVKTGHDEVGDLVESFARMRDSIQSLNRDLERRVVERTAQLQSANDELQGMYAALERQHVELGRVLEESRRLEVELRQAQKLEAVGRLAAGIAHEINTPVQFIGDNTRFLGEAFQSLRGLLEAQRRILAELAPPAGALAQLEAAAQVADLAYVLEEVPRAMEHTQEGIQRVATIVRALKDFAHPDEKEMVATDLNRALQATLEVARAEYKYVAEVETELGELPSVLCHAGDMNQVFVNVIVNAAHAIADVVKGTGKRGTIRVVTALEGETVHVSISDSGGGVPLAIREKIYDPFFTTKEVGRGSGQGLSIARHIVERHGGSITFETTEGVGTTFHVRLPVSPVSGATEAVH